MIIPARCWSAVTSSSCVAGSWLSLGAVHTRGTARGGEKAFSEALAQYGLTLTSGLALGIDGIAHRGALAAKGKTIAVLGNGLSDIYPHRHRALAKQIVESGGALLSEFPSLRYRYRGISRAATGLSAG